MRSMPNISNNLTYTIATTYSGNALANACTIVGTNTGDNTIMPINYGVGRIISGNMFYDVAITVPNGKEKCKHCGQWGARQSECEYCGAPIS
jgi:hypothetical protein